METNVFPKSQVTDLKVKGTSFDYSELKGSDKKRKNKVCIFQNIYINTRITYFLKCF